MREVVSGLDRSLYTEAAAKLKHNQVSFWLRQEQNGIKVGFSDDFSNQNLLVKSLDILLQKDGEGEAGLICQSVETTTLHWFPIQEAAWTTLSVAEFHDVFKSKGTFKVKRKPITLKKGVKTSIISVLDVPDVKDESEKLVVGQELFVQVVKQVETNDENKQRYLVESLKTQVILDCEIYEDCQPLQPGETLPVEVVSHIKGSPELITVVPVGKKPKYLDLPTWMTKQLPELGELRQSIRQYFRWRHSESFINPGDPSDLLDRLLCHYFNDTYGTTDGKAARNSDPKSQLEVAKQWEQQNRYKPEINAAFAIMAILLLNKHEETKLEAYQLTQNLGLRALRSLHIEVLYQRWFNTQDNRQRTDGLWQRLQELESEEHLYVPLKENSPAAIRQFCNAVEMRADKTLLPIAKSLSAALGELSSTVELEDHAWITKKLIYLYLTLHPKSRINKLQKYHTDQLHKILKRIDQNGCIMLLDPLHYHVQPNHYSKNLGKIDLWEELFPQEHIKADWKSWILQQIDHLDALTDKSIALGENINELKCRFRRINQIIEE